MFNDEELALIWFDYNGLKINKVEKILEKFDTPDAIFDAKLVKNAFFEIPELNEIKEELLKINKDEFADKVADELYKYNITPITYVSKEYPEKLKNISDPPLVIYVRGDVSIMNKKAVAIVGTRKPTTYGRIVTERFAGELAEAGLVTVSGLAYGIDTIVATASLDVNGKTIAVLAGGLDSIYPSQNKGLADKIVEKGGLLVTEYRPFTSPTQYAFIDRNRIISGLSLGTLIIEAGRTSGTMSTARHALEQGRELFVVPGNINSLQSEGTNNLIDEMPDVFTISPERILYRFAVKKKQKSGSAVQVDLSETEILNALALEELTFDELSEKVKMRPAELSAKLIKLEMFGLVAKGAGNMYYKV